MKPNNPVFNDSYRALIEQAADTARRTDAITLRVCDLFAAAAERHLRYFRRLTGKKKLIFPRRPETQEPPQDDPLVYTAEVDRILSLYGGVLSEIIAPLGREITIDAFHVCAALLLKPCAEVTDFLNLNGLNAADVRWEKRIRDEVRRFTDERRKEENQNRLPKELARWKTIRERIEARCFGQKEAISAIVSQIAAFRAQSPQDRNYRPLVLCLFGETGTGKTLAAELIRDAVAELNNEAPAPTLDLARYANEQLAVDLIGRDNSWRDGGRIGHLSELALSHPEGVLILDNFDLAHPTAVSHLVTAISCGTLADGYTGERVSFERNVIILTMNRGSEFLDTGKFFNLIRSNGGTLPREKLIEGLLEALTMCGLDNGGPLGMLLKKVDCPILFPRLDCDSTRKIILKALDRALRRVESTFGVNTEIDKEQFACFLIETLQRFGSAHGIDRLVEDIIATALQNVCIDVGFSRGTCRTVRYRIDPLPDPETTDARFDTSTAAGLQARTEARLAAAKRLDFTTRVTFEEASATLHITGLAYTLMPTIEDADWFAVRSPNVSWAELVGLEEPRRHLRRILAYFRSAEPEGLMPETGILLWGPPGTGKTSFAKALATELHAPFISVCGSDFQATHNDNRAIGRIHTLFTVARRNKAVIFIDELDAIGNRDSVIGAQASVINTFLSELDGTDARKVLVIGATNSPERLDPALTRPGRLHHRVKIDCLKNPEDRRRLIGMIVARSGKTLPPDLLEFMVETTDNWAPAGIQAILRETLHAAGDGIPTREHFVAARMTEFEGQSTQRDTLSDDEKMRVAIHESGHALLATRYNRKWIQLSLHGSLDSLGFIEFCRSGAVGKSARQLNEMIDIVLAGHAAERVTGEAAEGSEKDFRLASDYACRLIRAGLVGDEEIARAPGSDDAAGDWDHLRPRVNAILKERLALTVSYLKKEESLLKRTAEQLFRRGILFADELPVHPLPQSERSRS